MRTAGERRANNTLPLYRQTQNGAANTAPFFFGLAKEEAVLAGMSSGGALSAAMKLADEIESGVIVFIVCDRGDRYLSSDLFE